jgi:hypothetical protein
VLKDVRKRDSRMQRNVKGTLQFKILKRIMHIDEEIDGVWIQRKHGSRAQVLVKIARSEK